MSKFALIAILHYFVKSFNLLMQRYVLKLFISPFCPEWVQIWPGLNALSIKYVGSIILSCLSKVLLCSTVILERRFLKGCVFRRFFGKYVLPL